MGIWERLAISSLLLISSIHFLSSTVSANPIASPFDDAIIIAFINYPINGLILLALYLVLTPNGPNFTQMGSTQHTILFLIVVGIMSFTGAIVDSAAYYTGSIPVFLIACTIIGIIAVIVSVRFLRMDPGNSVKTGFVFFIINLLVWSALAEDLMIGEDNIEIAIFSAYIFFYFVLVVVFYVKGRRPVTAEFHPIDTWSSLPSDHEIKAPMTHRFSGTNILLLESLIVTMATFFLMIFTMAIIY